MLIKNKIFCGKFQKNSENCSKLQRKIHKKCKNQPINNSSMSRRAHSKIRRHHRLRFTIRRPSRLFWAKDCRKRRLIRSKSRKVLSRAPLNLINRLQLTRFQVIKLLKHALEQSPLRTHLAPLSWTAQGPRVSISKSNPRTTMPGRKSACKASSPWLCSRLAWALLQMERSLISFKALKMPQSERINPRHRPQTKMLWPLKLKISEHVKVAYPNPRAA